jgi:hypothetical protein
MVSSEEYRSSAAACLWHADNAVFPEDRILWLTLAQGWFQLANNTEGREALRKKRRDRPRNEGRP